MMMYGCMVSLVVRWHDSMTILLHTVAWWFLDINLAFDYHEDAFCMEPMMLLLIMVPWRLEYLLLVVDEDRLKFLKYDGEVVMMILTLVGIWVLHTIFEAITVAWTALDVAKVNDLNMAVLTWTIGCKFGWWPFDPNLWIGYGKVTISGRTSH